MQKVFSSVLDIDPNDPTVIELDLLAKKYGLKNMTEVAVAASELYSYNGKRVSMKLDLSTYQPLVKLLLSAAIINYAVSVHEEFFVSMPEDTMEKPRFYRTFSFSKHREYADKYLSQAKSIIVQMEN